MTFLYFVCLLPVSTVWNLIYKMCDPFLGRNFIFQKKDFLHNTFFTQFVLVTLPITILLKILRGRMHPHLKLGGTVRPVPLRLRPWFQKQPLALGPSISEPQGEGLNRRQRFGRIIWHDAAMTLWLAVWDSFSAISEISLSATQYLKV